MFWCVLNIITSFEENHGIFMMLCCMFMSCMYSIDVVFAISHPNRNLAWCIAFRSWITSMMWMYNLIYIYIFIFIHIISFVYAHATGLCLVINWRARIYQDDNLTNKWTTRWGLSTNHLWVSQDSRSSWYYNNTYMPFCHICSRHSAESVLHIEDQGPGVLFFF